MYQCEVVFEMDVDDVFHLKQIDERNFHNAYDADENKILFRADALFIHKSQKPVVIPVFAAQMKAGDWKWYVRFRLNKLGAWTFRIRVLSQYGNESVKFGFDSKDYERHPNAQRRFVVYDTKQISGPLEAPSQDDNPNYFYRWTQQGKIYERRPFFLLGVARPWVSEKKRTKDPWSLYSYLDRKNELFEPMQHLGDQKTKTKTDLGCNALLHWMSPWESLIVHQSPYEYWYDPLKGEFKWKQSSLIKQKSYYLSDARLEGNDMELGYKRYDQGRARHLDLILDLAKEHNILIFLVVMPHPLLRDCNHKWKGFHFGKGDEKDYKKCENDFKKYKKQPPSQLNGFQLFRNDFGETISIEEFFSMSPLKSGYFPLAKEKLFKHYANFWRYLIGRWTAHPALGGWILIDEMDGVGISSDWWWKNKKLTYEWHDNLIKLLREDESLEKWEENGVSLPYTGDYLRHPVTSSATDYEATYPEKRKEAFVRVKNMTSSSEKKQDANTTNKDESKTTEMLAFRMLNEFKELPDHGTWRGGEGKAQVDFVSHHAYHYVPTWGHWEGTYKRSNGKKFTGWQKSDQKQGAININTDSWLWDSLCMRLYKWSKENAKYKCPLLITEYGCFERDTPSDNYNQYGERYPSYSHFANWASLVLGHAGIPFKWNDGKEFGEMIGRTTAFANNPWNPKLYPNNYYEIQNIVNFLKNVDLSQLRKSSIATEDFRMSVVYKLQKSGKVEKFNVWGLANNELTILIAWIYDRTFSKEKQPLTLKVELMHADTDYRYQWFNTWTGEFMQGDQCQGDKLSDGRGTLEVPFPATFPVGNKKGIADGNDIAVYIRALKKDPFFKDY